MLPMKLARNVPSGNQGSFASLQFSLDSLHLKMVPNGATRQPIHICLYHKIPQ